MGLEEFVLAIILAGGRGSRLYNLTKERAKPAVAFAGYRLIDIMLSNLINVDIKHIHLLTEYKSDSLEDHIDKWHQRVGFGEFIRTISAQQRDLKEFSRGSGDSLYNSLLNRMQISTKLKQYLVLSGDHITDLDPDALLKHHRKHRADITLTVKEMKISDDVKSFGIVKVELVNGVYVVKGFVEKPKTLEEIPEIPDKPGFCFVNEANTVFNCQVLDHAVERFLPGPKTKKYDLSHDILTPLVRESLEGMLSIQAFVHANSEGKSGYWADVGSIDALFNANQDLLSVNPQFNIYNDNWWFRTFTDKYQGSGVKITDLGSSLASIFNAGDIISGRVEWSVLSYGVETLQGSYVDHSCIYDGCKIGQNARVIRTILDKDVTVGKYAIIDPSTLQSYRANPMSDLGISKNYTVRPLLREDGTWDHLLFQRSNDGRRIEDIRDVHGKSILDSDGVYIKQRHMKEGNFMEFVLTPGNVVSFSKYSRIPDDFVI